MPPRQLPELRQVSVSDILHYMECGRRGTIRYELQQWVGPSLVQRRGTALHKYVEHLLKTQAPDHSYLDTVDGDLRESIAPLIEAADRYMLPVTVPILGVERSFGIDISIPGYPTELVGRFDAILDMDGGVWSGQVKTFGKGQDLGRFLEKVRLSAHEIAYRSALRRLYPTRRVLGTYLWVFRTYLTKKQQEEGVPLVEGFPLLADLNVDEGMFRAISINARAVTQPNSNANTPVRLTACFGAFGNCPLIPYCYGRAPARGCLPHVLTNRYEDLPPRRGTASVLTEGTARFGVSPEASSPATPPTPGGSNL